jgi:hypothetical protein
MFRYGSAPFGLCERGCLLGRSSTLKQGVSLRLLGATAFDYCEQLSLTCLRFVTLKSS